MLNGKQRLLGSTAFVVAAFACAGLASPASAQEVVQTQAQDQAEQIAQAQGEDTIVVTGSRVRRDTFTSAAPIQVYDTDSALQIGITDIGELLQR